MYYSVVHVTDFTKHCIGAATSRCVMGPYTALPDPLFCPLEQGGAIDAAGFKDWQRRGVGWGSESSKNAGEDAPDNSWYQPAWWGGGAGGQRYVVYKIDGNAIGHGDLPGVGGCGNTVVPIVPTPLVLQAVAPDGVTVQGEPVTLLDHLGLAEQGVVEAPSLLKTWEGRYVLFFSSGCYAGGNYTVSYATADAVTGPFARQGVLIRTGMEGLHSPGGADVYWDAQHMAYHANYPNPSVGSRGMYTAMLDVQGNTVVIQG